MRSKAIASRSANRGWRGSVLWIAARSLVEAGGTDLAASLAYFTLLSFFPLIALVILIYASFLSPDTVHDQLLKILVFYFPVSQDFLNTATAHLFSSPLAAGTVAVIGMVWGSNGLFSATIRAVNRVFGTQPRPLLKTTVLNIVFAAGAVLLFVVSIGLTMLLQLILNYGAVFSSSEAPVRGVLLFILRTSLTVLPLCMTALTFLVLYRVLPNQSVPWRHAALGTVVAVTLFEALKHLSFWLITFSAQRSLIYGPISSVIFLLLWSHLGALIFLYGASLVKESGNNRRERTIGMPQPEAITSVFLDGRRS
ncbi:MAG: YihY/virulence factor BrkB family protein [Chloroflexi bacterium]|nr:YihY/virulence factor BrkB family protein [Chloroflexota bacterium]